MRRHPKRARVDPRSPRAWGTDDRSGFIGNHEDMVWQYEWAGFELINQKILVYPDELDIPNRQLGSIVLPPDPPSILNARPEAYDIEESPVSVRVAMDGSIRIPQAYGVESPMREVTVPLDVTVP